MKFSTTRHHEAPDPPVAVIDGSRARYGARVANQTINRGRKPALVSGARAARTTIALKLLMAVSGLAFIGFVLLHMYGNLKAFAGHDAFNEYAHHLRILGEPMLPFKRYRRLRQTRMFLTQLWILPITMPSKHSHRILAGHYMS